MGKSEIGKSKGREHENLSRRPIREFNAGLSKDGKFWLFRDTTLWIIPVNYLSAIRKGPVSPPTQTSFPADALQPQETGEENDRSN